MRSTAQRGWVKAQANFWEKFGNIIDRVDTSIVQPTLKTRNAAVDKVQAVGGKAVSVFKEGIGIFKLVMIVVLVIGAGYLVHQARKAVK